MPATPGYIWIAEQILTDARSGKYKPGDKLPSVTELCKIYLVSHQRSTWPSSASKPWA